VRLTDSAENRGPVHISAPLGVVMGGVWRRGEFLSQLHSPVFRAAVARLLCPASAKESPRGASLGPSRATRFSFGSGLNPAPRPQHKPWVKG
jgi:hypothetical protein